MHNPTDRSPSKVPQLAEEIQRRRKATASYLLGPICLSGPRKTSTQDAANLRFAVLRLQRDTG
jgi:hypothetical protein